jgi:hypothetical protein
MFFEVMNRERGRGEIGWATSSDWRSWVYQRIVLREPFHLSYPSVFKWNDHWLMIPETFEAGALRLYRAEKFPTRWAWVETILEGEFADHALIRHGGLWWLFVGTSKVGKPERVDTLELYFSNELGGPWEAHPQSPIVRDSARVSRPAGRVNASEAGMLRLTQDCSRQYGKEVNAARIEIMTKATYRERILSEPLLHPGRDAWHRRGMHHLDAHQLAPDRWMAAVDGYRRRVRFSFG